MAGGFPDHLLGGMERFGEDVFGLFGADFQDDLVDLAIFGDADADNVFEVGIGVKIRRQEEHFAGGAQRDDAVECEVIDPLIGMVVANEEPAVVVLLEEVGADDCQHWSIEDKRLVVQVDGLLAIRQAVDGVEPFLSRCIDGVVEPDDVFAFAPFQVEGMFQLCDDIFDSLHVFKPTELFEDDQRVMEFGDIIGSQRRVRDRESRVGILIGSFFPVEENGRLVAQFAAFHGFDILKYRSPRGVRQAGVDKFPQRLATGFGERLPGPQFAFSPEALVDDAVSDESVKVGRHNKGISVQIYCTLPTYICSSLIYS